jgi:hypothetical protein
MTFSSISQTNFVTKEMGQQVKRALPARKSVSELAFETLIQPIIETSAELANPKRSVICPAQHTRHPPGTHSPQLILGLTFSAALPLAPKGHSESTGDRVLRWLLAS